MITLTSRSNTIIEGRALKLTCNAIGSESIMYNWLLPNRTTVNSNILRIDNINRSDAGNYKCTALSTVGNKRLVVSTTTTITVFCKWTVLIFFQFHIIQRNNNNFTSWTGKSCFLNKTNLSKIYTISNGTLCYISCYTLWNILWKRQWFVFTIF